MAKVAWVLGFEKTQTTPYHPQADGQVEWFNRTLGAMLKAVVDPDQKDWDFHLHFLTVVYQATSHPATRFSPNFMMFREEVTLPTARYPGRMLEGLHGIFKEAYHCLGQAADRQKQYYDQTVRARSYKDRVKESPDSGSVP